MYEQTSVKKDPQGAVLEQWDTTGNPDITPFEVNNSLAVNPQEVRDRVAEKLFDAYWTDKSQDPVPLMYRAFAKADAWMAARAKGQ